MRRLLFAGIGILFSFFSDKAESKIPPSPPFLVDGKLDDKLEGESDDDAGEFSNGDALDIDFPSAAA
jgi:hypothetical protein